MSCWTDCSEEVLGEKVATLRCLGCVFENILHIAVRLGGLFAFMMIILGGFKYLTAGGDPKKAESAQKTLTAAVFGLVLMILAWFILLFIQEFTGVKVTEFKIG